MTARLRSKLPAQALYLFILVSISITGYTQRSQYTTPPVPWSVNSFDMDHDGDSDIVIGHKTVWLGTNPTISILTNTGQGYFVLSDTSKSYPGYQENIFSCNIDQDGFQDIVTFYSDFSTGTADRYLRVWYNDSGVFNVYADFSLNSSATFSGINHGDLNGDTYEDIVVFSNSSQFWGVLYGNGDGTLSSPDYFNIMDFAPLDIDCGDLNEDGREDVAVSGQDMEVYYSYPTGFQKTTFPDAQKSMLEILDFDGDGYKDLITGADLSLINITSLVIYRNQADTNLEALPEVHFSPGSSDFCINDLNGDGLQDLAFLSYFPYISGGGPDTTGGIYILYNLGGFQLEEPELISLQNLGELNRHFNSSDLDGNSSPDFAIVRSFFDDVQGNLELLFNDGTGNFSDTPYNSIVSMNGAGTSEVSAYPNPFYRTVNISFGLEQSSETELTVYDFGGRLINCLVKKRLTRGGYSFAWNGTDNGGNICKQGLYLVILKTDQEPAISIKLIKLN